jgi:CheY-like chemotaxis protein
MAEILVIDNNNCINELLKEILTGDGHQVTSAQTGMAAISLLEQKIFDIAFIDLGLPDISGLSILKKINQLSQNTIPIVISGSSDFNTVVSALREKAYDYLLKPFDIDEVSRVANAAIAERKKILETGPGKNSNAANPPISSTIKILAVVFSVFGIGASFLAGLTIQSQVFGASSGLPFTGIEQRIFLAISLCCCWAIMLLKDSEEGTFARKGNYLGRDALDLGISYTIFAAVLFFVFPLANCRAAILMGYGLGLAVITLNREILIPWLAKKTQIKQEGSKNIVIVGTGIQADRLTITLQKQFGPGNVKSISSSDWRDNQTTNIYNMSAPRLHDGLLSVASRDKNELYLEGNSINGDELNRIVNNFAGKRVIINLTEKAAVEESHPVTF